MSFVEAFNDISGKEWIKAFGLVLAAMPFLVTIGYYGGQIKSEIAELRIAVDNLKTASPDIAYLQKRVDSCCPLYAPSNNKLAEKR